MFLGVFYAPPAPPRKILPSPGKKYADAHVGRGSNPQPSDRESSSLQLEHSFRFIM